MMYNNPRPSLLIQPVVLVFTLFVLTVAWTGFYVGGDGVKFYLAAKEWLEAFPPDITREGAERLGVILPLAASLTLLGDSEFSAILPTSLYYIFFILFIAYALSRLTDPVTVIVACALLASVPVIVFNAVTPSSDMANLLYAALSFFFFYAALNHERRNMMLYWSGFFVGLEFISHTQAVALLLFYGILFLAGYRIERKIYLYMALGFMTVVFAEMVYYIFTGYNPFYHFIYILQSTHAADRFEGPPPEVGGIDNAGNLYIWPPINPILLTLVTQKYGLLYYLLYPALWWMIRGRTIRDEATTQLLRLLVALGVIWCLFALIALSQIKLYARYYLAATCCFFIVGVFWLRYVIWPNHKKITIVAVSSVLAVNFLCIEVENKEPRFGERALLEYLAVSNGQIYTDLATARYAKYFCRWEQIDCSGILIGEPTPGSMYFLNPNNSAMSPDPQWRQIWHLEQPRKWAGRIITSLGLESIVPGSIFRRLNQPNKAVSVYAIPEQAYGLQQ